MVNKVCDFVESNGIKGPIFILIGWMILFFFAVELRSKSAEVMMPIVALMGVIYLAIWTVVIIRGEDNGKRKEPKEVRQTEQTSCKKEDGDSEVGGFGIYRGEDEPSDSTD